MHLDLSQLSIPPAVEAPEPTPEEWADFATWAAGRYYHGTFWGRVAISLARRCRELEAEVERLRQRVKQTDWTKKL